MKVGFSIKVAGEMLTNIDIINAMVKDMCIKNQKDLVNKRSMRVLKWEKRSGYDGNDFMLNLFTIQVTGKGYRISRIIKRLYK